MTSSWMRELQASARLDFAEAFRSRWFLFCTLVYATLGAAFVAVGLRESWVLGYTGTGRMLLSFAHALVLLLPLLALTATGQVIGRARDDGTLELVLSQPIRRGAYFAGVSLTRYLILVVPLALLMLGAALYGRFAQGAAVPWGFLGGALLVCAALLLAFTGIGLAISTFVRNQARAMMYVILVWAMGVALLDFGLIAVLLRWSVNPRVVFVLAAVNPVECARLALLSSLRPDLAGFGPVGFYLATRVGGPALFALGVGWPALLGIGAWFCAWRRFRTGDAV